jgi:hypothetical protein
MRPDYLSLRCEAHTEMSLNEIECNIMYWIQLAEDNISSEIS